MTQQPHISSCLDVITLTGCSCYERWGGGKKRQISFSNIKIKYFLKSKTEDQHLRLFFREKGKLISLAYTDICKAEGYWQAPEILDSQLLLRKNTMHFWIITCHPQAYRWQSDSWKIFRSRGFGKFQLICCSSGWCQKHFNTTVRILCFLAGLLSMWAKNSPFMSFGNKA